MPLNFTPQGHVCRICVLGVGAAGPAAFFLTIVRYHI
jgi:hypothetical protein